MKKIVFILVATCLPVSLDAAEKADCYESDQSVLNIHIKPQPQAIVKLPFIMAEEGSIEVHFRDAGHLKNIIEQTPYIEPKENLYFVKNAQAQDGMEFASTTGLVQRGYFIHVVADYPVEVSGRMTIDCPLVLPKGSDFTNLCYNGTGGIKIGINSQQKALELIKILNSGLGEDAYEKQTSEVKNCLEERKKDRQSRPLNFPDLFVLCREFGIIHDRDISVTQKDYVASDKPFLYKANSSEGIHELRLAMPTLNQHILYIDSDCEKPGIAGLGIFCLRPGFEVVSEGDLLFFGTINIPFHNMSIKSEKSIWIICESFEFWSFYVKSKNLCFLEKTEIKPEGLPVELWNCFLSYRSCLDSEGKNEKFRHTIDEIFKDVSFFPQPVAVKLLSYRTYALV